MEFSLVSKEELEVQNGKCSAQVPQQAVSRARTRTQASWLPGTGSLGRLSQEVTCWNRTLLSTQSSLSLRAVEMELNL